MSALASRKGANVTIAPIETHYNGYKFRSRLEARWALFYDTIGYSYSYENDPISVSGENYLPDFLVRSNRGEPEFIHEVKPESARADAHAQYVYLAGKMESGWRGREDTVSMDDLLMHGHKCWMNCYEGFLRSLGDVWFRPTGPFPIGDSKSHMRCGFHDTEYGVMKRQIINACIHSINSSDLVCAHLDSNDCYGTLAEIGIAYSRNKAICVTVDQSLEKDMDRPDFWFVYELANHAEYVNGEAAARAVHNIFIKEHTNRTYRLASSLALTGGGDRHVAVTFGDPMHVLMDNSYLNWKTPISYVCRHNAYAAEAARAHRFHG